MEKGVTHLNIIMLHAMWRKQQQKNEPLISYIYPFPQYTGWECIILKTPNRTWIPGNQSKSEHSIEAEKAKPPFPDLSLIWGRLLLSVTVNQGDKDINILCKVVCDQFTGSTCLCILYKCIYLYMHHSSTLLKTKPSWHKNRILFQLNCCCTDSFLLTFSKKTF